MPFRVRLPPVPTVKLFERVRGATNVAAPVNVTLEVIAAGSTVGEPVNVVLVTCQAEPGVSIKLPAILTVVPVTLPAVAVRVAVPST